VRGGRNYQRPFVKTIEPTNYEGDCLLAKDDLGLTFEHAHLENKKKLGRV